MFYLCHRVQLSLDNRVANFGLLCKAVHNTQLVTTLLTHFILNRWLTVSTNYDYYLPASCARKSSTVNIPTKLSFWTKPSSQRIPFASRLASRGIQAVYRFRLGTRKALSYSLAQTYPFFRRERFRNSELTTLMRKIFLAIAITVLAVAEVRRTSILSLNEIQESNC